MNLKEKNVLVIDPDKFHSDLLGGHMAQLGVPHLRVAMGIVDAINQISASPHSFDLILCGLDMSKMDGLEFLQHLILREFRGAIVLTGEAGGQFLESVRKLGGLHILNMLGAIGRPAGLQDLAKVLGCRLALPRRQEPGATSVLEITAEELDEALEEGGLSLRYQPQFDVRSEAIVGVKSLIRWDHPRFGPISPVGFIAQAEQHGLVDKLAERLLAASMAQAGRWRAEGVFLGMSVGVSAQNLEMSSLPEFLSAMAERFGLPPAYLTLEVNEGQLVKGSAAIAKTLPLLRKKGIGLALEGFGNALASAEQLGGPPFTQLKLSRAYIANARMQPGGTAQLKQDVAQAKKLGMKVVAEGVEAEWHWSLLKEVGCDLAQGNYLAQAMSSAQLVSCLKNWNETTRTIKLAYGQVMCAPVL